ncbi:MAG TPA: PEP/pyruvate-binding domain-containing protein [Candidatus Limnocylindria bacterium]|jgi:pyruvate,water dikinase|nr:PEP/pyruvate-binding domain-containing protein [Candidatus Limnocylindria bacterium]
MSFRVVLPLSALGAGDIAVAGGKGANLGELIRAGFPVPDGFVITTEAYAAAARAAGVDRSDPVDARERLTATPMPTDIENAIRDAHRALGGRVAVRSSATAEDLPEASFAGQQDTILDVEGDDALLDAVRRCWASLWNDRAVAYRATHEVDETVIRLAVVVQRMVPATIAGVLFTADPITGRRRRAAIDAVRGLGEQLVSGAVNPDHYLVDASTGAVLERRGSILDDARLRELATMGARVEAHFGRPQDIEWAIDERKLWIVQSRDVTTLYPIPASAPDPDRDLRVYLSVNVAQGVLQPFTPMGLQTFRLMGAALAGAVGRPVADPAAGVSVIADAGMRLWVDLTGLVRNIATREIPVRVMSVMEARSSGIFAHLLDDPRLAPRGGSRARSLVSGLRAVLRTGAPPVVVRALLRPDATRERLLRQVDAIVRLDPGAMNTPMERLDAFERLFLVWPPRMFPRLVAMVAAGFLSYNLAGRLLRGVATDDELRIVLRGLPFNPTTEMDLELWAIARRTRDDAQARAALAGRAPEDLSADFRRGALPAVLQRELAAFLERYGHRAIAEIDLGLPRWSEDPAYLLGAIANYQRLDSEALAPDAQFARGVREAEAMIAALLSRVHGPRRVLARALLRRVRALAGVREAPKFHVIRVFARGRAILAPVGESLAGAGRVAAADDIWFLTIPEARRAVGGENMHGVVAARRSEYRREMRRRHIPRVLLSDGTDAEAAYASPAADGAIRGAPASPGIARGVAHVLRSPAGARLEPGEVLVAPATDPGWTPLFLTASALVMEMGGMMSHGAVVAREYGIPAVVGVPNATERIATGQRIIVDGSAGTVAPEAS